MKITKTRIRSLGNYLLGLNNNDEFYIALTDLSNVNKIQRAGFTNDLNPGEQILPAAVKRISNFNANGGFKKQRNLPKEIVYRQADIKDWHGYYHTVDIPYKRYPRIPILAPNVELTVVIGPDNQKLIRSPKLKIDVTPESEIIHIINLFLELFGECETVQANLVPVFNVPITRLNWNLLPPGNYPWNVLKNNIQGAIGNVGTNRRRIIERRLETISNHNPNYVAVGNAGFSGYIVFGFQNKSFFILESIHKDNATYVFGNDWKQLSQMTKAHILTQNLHQYRFIHKEGWKNQIEGLF